MATEDEKTWRFGDKGPRKEEEAIGRQSTWRYGEEPTTEDGEPVLETQETSPYTERQPRQLTEIGPAIPSKALRALKVNLQSLVAKLHPQDLRRKGLLLIIENFSNIRIFTQIVEGQGTISRKIQLKLGLDEDPTNPGYPYVILLKPDEAKDLTAEMTPEHFVEICRYGIAQMLAQCSDPESPQLPLKEKTALTDFGKALTNPKVVQKAIRNDKLKHIIEFAAGL